MVLGPIDRVDIEAQRVALERGFITRRIRYNG